jgi:photoactive yellow protein
MNVSTSQEIPQIDFATLDLLPYGIIVVDEQGIILYYNLREEQISNRRRDVVLGRNFFSEIAPCTQVQEFYGRFRETMDNIGGVANFHFRFPFPDRPREVEISLTRFEHMGAALCMISVNDVTEQDAVRERIVRGERLRELGEVAAGVAHNFNNLLTVIRGHTELLQRVAEGERAKRYIETILKATNDAVQMVGRIQESTRQSPSPSTDHDVVPLNEVIADSITFIADYVKAAETERSVNVSVETELAEGLFTVHGNAASLREVFVNLLRNGVDAISGEGRIIIRSRAQPDERIVEVSDTGEGMNTEVMNKLFRPLFTTKGARGTGLGLATSYAIVRRHGGDIEVRSTQGGGTTFVVRFPKV